MEEAWELAALVMNSEFDTNCDIDKDGFLVQTFLHSIRIATEEIRNAYEWLFSIKDTNHSEQLEDKVWQEVERLTDMSSLIWRILHIKRITGQKTKIQEFTESRKKVLLNVLGLTSRDVPRELNSLRNRLTHWDEDLDQWYLDGRKERKVLVRRVCRPDDFVLDRYRDENVAQHYNYKKGILRNLGAEYSVHDIFNASLILESRVKEACLKLGIITENNLDEFE